MKRTIASLLALLLLTGCGANAVPEVTFSETISLDIAPSESSGVQTASEDSYQSRFDAETRIHLSDDSILISVPEGQNGDAPVKITRDIIYYEDRETYDSGNPYGEGTAADQHSAEEAAAHQVINITSPGAYRVTGSLSAGQIRVDLGKNADEEKDAVVELILDNADITCTVAPAILFLNVYECDENASVETASATVDTTNAGANLILEGNNTINGSHVAKIFKDKEEEKKLWKQDGAIYSYQSMNVFGPGTLELTADNEGLDTEMHLTILGGNISIYSQNDGINTNEDGISVTTIHGGNLTIFAGLGAEGDGIDSNGYLVINGGTVVSAANPASDAGLDSDLGSYIHGGTVIAFGSAMDWAESESGQVTMNLQFAAQQKAGSEIRITTGDGTEIFSFTPEDDHARSFSGLILSCPALKQGETYHVYVDDTQMAYTGTDIGRGGPGGRDHVNRKPGKMPQLPEGETFPADFDPAQRGDRGQRPEPPEGKTFPEGDMPRGGNRTPGQAGESSTDFYMNDMVNFFSGVTPAM